MLRMVRLWGRQAEAIKRLESLTVSRTRLILSVLIKISARYFDESHLRKSLNKIGLGIIELSQFILGLNQSIRDYPKFSLMFI